MFKETQERKVDLKEDDPSMVELMVKFFYTIDYDNTPANSELSLLGLHAHVYTIADKYQVLVLKSIALAKFKGALATSYKDGKAMVEAAHALTQCIPFPSCDPTLHDLMSEAWLHGGDELFANVGEAEIALLFAEVGWLSVTLASRMLKTSKSDSLRGRCITGCTQLTRMESGTVMAGVTAKCSRCSGKSGNMSKVSYVEMKSVWEA
jgi:hypothetical protein